MYISTSIKMPARVDIPLPELIGLIEEHKGNVSRIGRSIKRHRHTIQARIDESKQAQAALTDARETRVDAVEDAIFDMALGGNITAAIFVLKASPEAKRRGWGDRTELTGKDGGPVASEIIIKYADDNDTTTTSRPTTDTRQREAV